MAFIFSLAKLITVKMRYILDKPVFVKMVKEFFLEWLNI